MLPLAKVAVPVLIRVVNLPVEAVVAPIAGGLDRSNVPPRVIVPEDVIGPPVSVIPFTVPVVATLVTPGLITAILVLPS